MQPCDDALAARQSLRWSLPDERRASTADVIRRSIPPHIAAELARFGRSFDGSIVRRTSELYSEQRKVYERSEINLTKDIAYGPRERQRIDIHTPTMRSGIEQGVPSVAVFHGGGLVGGNRGMTTNVADYFASLGLIGVNASYRLAPAYKWPEGARDVGAVVTWLHENVADFGGDPEAIFVMGLSSGALHAATYVFRPELLPDDTARAAGAMLLSGPYTFDFDNPSRGEVAYFGEDQSRYPQRVVVGNVSRSEIPVLFTTAEWDIPRYTRAFASLLEELVTEHGVMPRYKQSVGHNHTSQLLSVGTADTGVSAELVDFIYRTVEAN